MTAPAPPAADPSARHVSPWTARDKVWRAAWAVVQATAFGLSPRPLWGWRNGLLRRFGAAVHPTAHVHPTARIEVPWHLTVGPNTAVGDGAILYCLGPVTLGARVTVSQRAHLCAGTHDYTRPDMPLVRRPIAVGDDVWVAAEAFVGPGVTVGDGAVVGARAVVVKDVPAGAVVAGNPARVVKRRHPPGGAA